MTSARNAIIQYASSPHHQKMLSITENIHKKYCSLHSIDYLSVHQPLSDGRSQHWRKIGLMREVAEAGYDKFAWLDADCVLVKSDFDIFDAIGFGIGVCECFDSPTVERHLNTGVILCSNSIAVRDFLEIWDATPRIGDSWQDQSAFIFLMKGRLHRDIITILSNRFNALDVHMEARDPFIKAYHGDPDRIEKIEDLVRSL